MKEELIKYTCDQCKSAVMVSIDTYTKVRFWNRLYRTVNTDDISKTKLHFCSDKCTIEYLQNMMSE